MNNECDQTACQQPNEFLNNNSKNSKNRFFMDDYIDSDESNQTKGNKLDQ